MKSRISIDIDSENNPIIRVDFQESEDLRDKMLSRFLDKTAGSFLAKVRIEAVSSTGMTYSIVPVADSEVDIEHNRLSVILHNREVSLGGLLKDTEACPMSSPLKNNAPDTCN